MLIAPYLNDNPYRLLGIGSAASQAGLQQAADLADKTAAIGIPPSSGLLKVFGAEMLPACTEKVRALGVDSMERTVYRLFWPFDYQPQPGFKGTLADLLQADVIGPAPSFRILHLRFVIAWVKYLVQPSALRVMEVLDSFDHLCKEDLFYAFLVELLVQDGEELDQAQHVGNHAPGVVLERLLVVFRRQGVQWWETGDIAAATALVEALTSSTFEEGLIDQILVDLVACGEQEAARLQGVIQNYRGWTLTQPLYDPVEVAKLRLLAAALQARMPVAQRWLQVVEDRIRQVALAMRDQALDLATRQDEQETAVRILAHIRLLPLPEDLARQIRDSEAQLQAVVTARQEEIWRGITPIGSGPSMATINGVGTKVYGRTPFAGDPAWYFTTYYFVVLFVPVFPIRRYLVADAPGKGWYFRASAPLTKANKIHLGTSLALICLFFLAAVFGSQSPAVSNANSSSSHFETQQPGYPTTPDGASSSGTAADDSVNQKRKQLQAEGDALDADLKRVDASIEHHRAVLDSAAEKLHTDAKTLDTSSRSAVNAYNARLKEFNRSKQKFQDDVDTYNKKVKRQNEIVDRLHKLGN